jgi:hypothetical protein
VSHQPSLYPDRFSKLTKIYSFLSTGGGINWVPLFQPPINHSKVYLKSTGHFKKIEKNRKKKKTKKKKGEKSMYRVPLDIHKLTFLVIWIKFLWSLLSSPNACMESWGRKKSYSK